MELPLITDDEAWIALPVGAKAQVQGFVEFIVSDGITMSFPDWSQLLIDCPDTDLLVDLMDEDVTITVIRTEDGVFANEEAILEALSKIKQKENVSE